MLALVLLLLGSEPLSDTQVAQLIANAGAKNAPRCVNGGFLETPQFRVCTPAARISEQADAKRKELGTLTVDQVPERARQHVSIYAYPPMKMSASITAIKKVLLRNAAGVTAEPIEEKPETETYSNAFGAKSEKTTLTLWFKTEDVRRLAAASKDGEFEVVIATDGGYEPRAFKVKAQKVMPELFLP